jgi:hypothetical protein
MDEQFAHPSANSLLAEVRRVFENKPIFQKRDNPVLFLCGGPISPHSKNMRRAFLGWSKEHLPQLVILLAEDAYSHTKLYDPPETVNLSDFEALIGSIADCVLVFPESEGSFAELGFFSGSELGKKVLVANSVAYQTEESFVNLGPIKTIDSISFLSPTVQVLKRGRSFDFSPVQQRLRRLLDRTNRRAFKYTSYKNLDYLGKLLITLEMINIFHFVTLASLGDCITAVFDNANPKELKRILCILAGARYIRVQDHFYSLETDKATLLEFDGIRIDDLKARVLHYYQKHQSILYRRLQSGHHARR